MLEKIIIEKYYNRPYNQFNNQYLYGHWGQTNTKGDWRNYRFNPYQMHKMQKFGYEFQRPTNNFQNVGMSSDFSQSGFGQQGGFMQQGGYGQQGGFVQQGGFGGQGMMMQQPGQVSYGNGVVQMGGVVNLSGGNMGGMGMNQGMGMGGMGMNMGMDQQNMGMGMGMNQNMGGKNSFYKHRLWRSTFIPHSKHAITMGPTTNACRSILLESNPFLQH